MIICPVKCEMKVFIHPFPNFNSCDVQVWEWISNFIPRLTDHVITYPRWDLSQVVLIKWHPGSNGSLTDLETSRMMSYFPGGSHTIIYNETIHLTLQYQLTPRGCCWWHGEHRGWGWGFWWWGGVRMVGLGWGCGFWGQRTSGSM